MIRMQYKTVTVIDNSAIGVRVRNTRRESGMNLKQLAKLMNIHFTHLSELERGNRSWSQAKIDRVNGIFFGEQIGDE